jgi:hypothetical protein
LTHPQPRNRIDAVITGFNTDVLFQGVTYHVQTEDKGPANPLILTLVYKGGEILAAKRLNYSDKISGPDDEATIAALLEEQHKTVMDDVRKGKYAPSTSETIMQDLSLDDLVLQYLASRFPAPA